MEIRLSGLIIIVGNYGSGKTEIAVNLAADRRKAGLDVNVADLDLVNPYFRAREARNSLDSMGIRVVLPPKQYLQADLPILSPAIAGVIRNPGQLSILDVGGDDVGATVLASLSGAFAYGEGRMMQVVNPFRPFTDTVEGCIKMRESIERASKLTVSGLIGNANLIDETTVDHVYDGYDFIRRLADESELPIEFITVGKPFLPEIDRQRFACPILPIERQLVPPWKTAAGLGR